VGCATSLGLGFYQFLQFDKLKKRIRKCLYLDHIE